MSGELLVRGRCGRGQASPWREALSGGLSSEAGLTGDLRFKFGDRTVLDIRVSTVQRLSAEDGSRGSILDPSCARLLKCRAG